MTPNTSKINRASFQAAFNDAALVPDKVYSAIISVSTPGYVPEGVEVVGTVTPKSQTILARATGSAIEALELDEKVRRVEAPIQHRPLRFP